MRFGKRRIQSKAVIPIPFDVCSLRVSRREAPRSPASWARASNVLLLGRECCYKKHFATLGACECCVVTQNIFIHSYRFRINFSSCHDYLLLISNYDYMGINHGQTTLAMPLTTNKLSHIYRSIAPLKSRSLHFVA